MVQSLLRVSQNKTLSLLILFAFVTLAGPIAQAAVLFEGYSKVNSGGVHIGYFVSRYEYDTKTNIIKSTYYLRTNALGGNVTESLRATSKTDLAKSESKFIPIGYVYTSQAGDTSTLIEASVQDGKLKAKVVKNGGEPTTIEKDFPKDAFFSTFLAYVMLKAKDGIATSNKYNYEAVAEEDATLYKGMAFVKEMTEHKGQKAYKVLNEFKGQKFITFASQKGEMLATRSPLQSIETELVATPNEATKGIELNPEDLKLVFGDIPRGTTNSLTAAATQAPTKAKAAKNTETADPGKKSGVPGGKGIIIKGESGK